MCLTDIGRAGWCAQALPSRTFTPAPSWINRPPLLSGRAARRRLDPRAHV
jgi:hypothetical protein